MTETLTPKATAERPRETYRKSTTQLDEFAREIELPEALRALAEKNIAQTRELYERSRGALEAVVDSWEKSFDAAGQGVVALNRKMIDIAQRNINSSFDLAKSMAGAKTLSEAMDLQSAYWRQQMGAFQQQAEEVRTLSNKVATAATAPLTEQMSRGMEELKSVTQQ